jgi:hypothetical protein
VSDPVVFLAFDNPKADRVGAIDMMACSHCKNKTFTAVFSDTKPYPMLRCAACTQDIGRFGWAPPGE